MHEARAFTRDTWAERLKPLFRRPGEWVAVAVLDKNSARSKTSQLRRGVVADVNPAEFQFRTRRLLASPGERVVDARYLGHFCLNCGANYRASDSCPLCGYDKEAP